MPHNRYDLTAQNSPLAIAGCDCTILVDKENNFGGGNTWQRLCSCLNGWDATLPYSDDAVAVSDTVSRMGRWPIV